MNVSDVCQCMCCGAWGGALARQHAMFRKSNTCMSYQLHTESPEILITKMKQNPFSPGENKYQLFSSKSC